MNETVLKIRLFGDPVLRRKAKYIERINSVQRDTLSKMAEAMYGQSGIGLAAPQIGINEAMVVVDVGSGLYKLINPKIVKKKGCQVMEEGCLSIPGVCIRIKRAKYIRVEALDEFAKSVTIEAQDLLACAFQHEIDHLKGRLIVDYASFFERLKIRKNLKVLKKRTKDEELPESKTKSQPLQL